MPAGQKSSAEVGISSVLQRGAACCSVLQRVAKSDLIKCKMIFRRDKSRQQRHAFQVFWKVLQLVAAGCGGLQRFAS